MVMMGNVSGTMGRWTSIFRGCCHGRAIVKQSMMTAGILTALFGGLIDVAVGGVIINGVAADQTTFLNMLNAASPNGAWTAPGNTLTFTANNAARNNFETALLAIRNDAVNNVTLRVGTNQGGVLVGAFNGGGTQTLDLADIAAFPAASANLATQSATIIHEVSEVYNSVANAVGFNPSHLVGIAAENAQLAATGSTGQRGAPPDPVRNLGGGVREIDVRWTDTANPATRFLIVRFTGALAITNIRPGGIFDPSATYDGTDYDLQIVSIRLASSVPEPSTMAMMGTAMTIGFVMRHRQRRMGSSHR